MPQCFAVVEVYKRCSNLSATEDSKHCKIHSKKSRKLYLKYKKLCDKTLDLEFPSETMEVVEAIGLLQQNYVMYEKAYQARKKHRNYAICLECYDQGHNYQLDHLVSQSNKCEEYLSIYYKRLAIEDKKQDSKSHEHYRKSIAGLDPLPPIVLSQSDRIDSNSCKLINKKIFDDKVRQFKKQKVQDEKEMQLLLSKYIRQNKEKYRQSAIDQLVQGLKSIVNYKEEFQHCDSLQFSVLMRCFVQLDEHDVCLDVNKTMELFIFTIPWDKVEYFEQVTQFLPVDELFDLAKKIKTNLVVFRKLFYSSSVFWHRPIVPIQNNWVCMLTGNSGLIYLPTKLFNQFKQLAGCKQSNSVLFSKRADIEGLFFSK